MFLKPQAPVHPDVPHRDRFYFKVATLLCFAKYHLTSSGHERPLTQIKFNAEGDLLFSCSKDYVISAWYSHNGERLGTYDGNNGSVWSVDVDCNVHCFCSLLEFTGPSQQNPDSLFLVPQTTASGYGVYRPENVSIHGSSRQR
jgi:WD40 repeat protein